MKNKYALAIGLGLFIGSIHAQTQKGISKDSSIITSWATGVSINRGWVNMSDTSVKDKGTNKASYGIPSAALGKAGTSSLNVVSLGDGGEAILTFDRPITNGPGSDFAVFENGMKHTGDSVYSELAFVEVSSDGKRFVRFPAISKTQTIKQTGSFSPLWSDNISNMAGNLLQGYGSPFDLNDIKDSTNIDLYNIRFVKIIDAVGSIDGKYASEDSKGNKVNDPFPTPFWSSGFDLDAVGVINGGLPYEISTFESLQLNNDSYYTPSSTDTSFVDGFSVLSTKKTDFGVDAFSYSNMRDDSTAGYTNGFSAITAGGVSAPSDGGSNYAVAYVTGWGQKSSIAFTDKKAHIVNGMYVTNATYAYLSMKLGDSYAKKFGGTSGNDADWFKLQIYGIKNDGSHTDTVDFYLADYRFTDNSKDYIVNSWQWVDLQSLGEIKSIEFVMASSDEGTWGMNTPSYFCIDNITVMPENAIIKVADVTISALKNSAKKTVNIAQLFTAYSMTGVTYSEKSNSNKALVIPTIVDDELELDITANTTGTATIVIEATVNGKKQTANITLKVEDEIVSISESVSSTNVYPNPCSSDITIVAEIGSYLYVYNEIGNMVMNEIAKSLNTILNTSQLSTGCYFVKIVNAHSTDIVTILKK